MNLYKNLKKLELEKVYVSEIFEDIKGKDYKKSLEILLSDKPAKQITILNIDDGFLQLQINYRYLNSAGTFTTGGYIALSDYPNAKDLISIEKEFNSAYPLVHKNIRLILSSKGIQTKDNEDIDMESGRFIQGTGSLFLYNSNEYNHPKHNEMDYAAELLTEELSVAAISLASMFDMFRLIIKDEQSLIHPIICEHVKEKIGLKEEIGFNKELIEYFLNKEETINLCPDMTGLKKGDELLGIGSNSLGRDRESMNQRGPTEDYKIQIH